MSRDQFYWVYNTGKFTKTGRGNFMLTSERSLWMAGAEARTTWPWARLKVNEGLASRYWTRRACFLLNANQCRWLQWYWSQVPSLSSRVPP